MANDKQTQQHLRRAVAHMEATRVQTRPVRALREWRQRAQQQALATIVARSRGKAR